MLPKNMQIIYCVGAQKAGTSWLFDQLQKSRDVHGGFVKEMHYFDTLYLPSDQNHSTTRLETLNALTKSIKPGFAPGNAKRLRQIRQVTHQLACFGAEKGDHKEYVRSLIEGRTTERALLDFTPSYSGLPVEGFKDMASLGATKFIFVLRDPVSRMWSQIRMRTKMLGTAKDDEDFHRISVEHARHLKEINRYPNIFRANYVRTIERLEQAVPTEDIKYVFYEDMFQQDTIDHICAFLDVGPVAIDAEKQVNLGKAIPLDADIRALIGAELRVQYDGIMKRFGDAVPQKWHDTLAKIDSTSAMSTAGVVPEATTPVARGARKVKSLFSRLKPVERNSGKRPVAFLHIPKTAGQTISKQVRFAIGSRNVSPILLHSQADPDQQFPDGFRYYGGHLDWVSMAERLEDCFSFSVLRDPKERLASLYFFLKRQGESMSPEELERPENTGKRFLLSTSADDYFFQEDMKFKRFIMNGYFNKYCYYFASRRMNGWTDLKNVDPKDVLGMAQTNINEVSRIYGMGHLDVLAQDLSSVLQAPISVDGPATNVGPEPKHGSRWDDLCALFEHDGSADRLLECVSLDYEFIDSLDLANGPRIGLGGNI